MRQLIKELSHTQDICYLQNEAPQMEGSLVIRGREQINIHELFGKPEKGKGKWDSNHRGHP